MSKIPKGFASGTQKNEMLESSDEFHKSLGYCITEWAFVDSALFQICLTALRCPKSLAAIIYYRNVTLGGRMALVNDLVKAILPPTPPGMQPHPSLTAWKDEFRKFNTLSEIRNRLAHDPIEPLVVFGVVNYLDISAFDSPPSAITMFQSLPSKDKPLNPNQEPARPLTVADLRAHSALTAGLQSSLHNFLYAVLMPQILEPPSPHAAQPKA